MHRETRKSADPEIRKHLRAVRASEAPKAESFVEPLPKPFFARTAVTVFFVLKLLLLRQP